MTSDRIGKYKGTNDQRSKKKGVYITKKTRHEKVEDEKMQEYIKNKCMVIGCVNQYEFFDYNNTFCKKCNEKIKSKVVIN
jgi:hypothetical protein